MATFHFRGHNHNRIIPFTMINPITPSLLKHVLVSRVHYRSPVPIMDPSGPMADRTFESCEMSRRPFDPETFSCSRNWRQVPREFRLATVIIWAKWNYRSFVQSTCRFVLGFGDSRGDGISFSGAKGGMGFGKVLGYFGVGCLMKWFRFMLVSGIMALFL